MFDWRDKRQQAEPSRPISGDSFLRLQSDFARVSLTNGGGKEREREEGNEGNDWATLFFESWSTFIMKTTGKHRRSRESAPIVSYLFRLHTLSCTYNSVNIVTNGTTEGETLLPVMSRGWEMAWTHLRYLWEIEKKELWEAMRVGEEKRKPKKKEKRTWTFGDDLTGLRTLGLHSAFSFRFTLIVSAPGSLRSVISRGRGHRDTTNVLRFASLSNRFDVAYDFRL